MPDPSHPGEGLRPGVRPGCKRVHCDLEPGSRGVFTRRLVSSPPASLQEALSLDPQKPWTAVTKAEGHRSSYPRLPLQSPLGKEKAHLACRHHHCQLTDQELRWVRGSSAFLELQTVP